MNKQITFRGMDHSPVMEQHIDQQLAKIERFLENETEPIYLHVVLDAERTHHHHNIELGLKTPHYDLHIRKRGPEFYKVLDEAIDALYLALQEKKRELIDTYHTGRKKG
jgi:ribosomal subunit interface protein